MEIKKGYAFVILFLFVATIAESQPNNAPDCHPDGPFISTAPLPYSGQSYQTNTWNWMQEHLYASNNYNYVDESNLNTPPGLENPFYLQTGNQYLSNLAYGDNSDFYPVDGWQLIKRDFGQLYNTTQNDQCSPAPYFILYNKYSGRLRVIASAYGLGDNQLVDIDLHFMDPGNWRDLNLTNYGTSGLFAHYGNVT